MLTLTPSQKEWYLMWIYAKPQSDPLQEAARRKFLQEFHVRTAFELLSEIETWPINAFEQEPGEIVMQRWFRLFRLKMQGREAQRRIIEN